MESMSAQSTFSDSRLPISDKNRFLAALLAFFFGMFGAHRFYVGKIGTGVLQLLTFGGLGFWCFIDFLIILFGEFKDADGCKIVGWRSAGV